jgi:flotillin
MRVKAAAYREYNQAAVLDKLISNLPEVVKALAEPLAKVDKINIVSTGGGANGNLGASRITGDMVNMLAQVPALIEALTGAKVGNLIERIPGLSDGTTVESAAPAPDAARSANGATPEPQASVRTSAQAKPRPAPSAPPADKAESDEPQTPPEAP